MSILKTWGYTIVIPQYRTQELSLTKYRAHPSGRGRKRPSPALGMCAIFHSGQFLCSISRNSGPHALITGCYFCYHTVINHSGLTALVVDNSVITGITMVITFGLSYRLVDIQYWSCRNYMQIGNREMCNSLQKVFLDHGQNLHARNATDKGQGALTCMAIVPKRTLEDPHPCGPVGQLSQENSVSAFHRFCALCL